MRSFYLFLILVFTALGSITACSQNASDTQSNSSDSVDKVQRRGTYARGAGKSDGTNSCLGHCETVSPSGCWCDESCATYGDCCPDKQATCDETTPSCENTCGRKSTDGCWCDENCANYGDCCPDIQTACSPEPTQKCCNPDALPDFLHEPTECCADGIWHATGSNSPCEDLNLAIVSQCEVPKENCCNIDAYPEFVHEPTECCEDGIWHATGSNSPCQDLSMMIVAQCE
jgi:hypothetical protein